MGNLVHEMCRCNNEIEQCVYFAIKKGEYYCKLAEEFVDNKECNSYMAAKRKPKSEYKPYHF